jgi:hypothetical protein
MNSMELYASAHFDISDRSRFVTLMTALEALSEQRPLGQNAAQALDEVAACLETSPSLSDDPGLTSELRTSRRALRESLRGRIRELKRESVRQAILRTVREYVSEEDLVAFVDQAYGKRSKILHTGLDIAELSEVTSRLESVLRRIYSSILEIQLEQPA